MTIDEIKVLTEKYEDVKYFANDPVMVVRRYSDQRDIEIAAVVCSTLSFGNRQQIYKACEKTMALMGDSPYEYIMSGEALEYRTENKCWYRMLTMMDYAVLCLHLKQIYSTYSSIEVLLLNSKDYIETLTHILYGCKGIPKNNKSCCKRLTLMLRWLIRQDSSIDIGLWKNLDKSKLLLPLDVHSLNTLRELGVITRKRNDMKTVLQATEYARIIFPEDPTKLDFFLFGYSYGQAHPREFEEPKEEEYKATTLDLLLSATYLILWLNDCATNLIKELEYDANLRDKETRTIYGALKRRINEYQREINSIVGTNNAEFFAFFNEEMDNAFYPLVYAVKEEVMKAYEENGIEDAGYLSLVETARFMTEYSCKVNSKCVKDLLKVTDKAVSLRSYRLTELYKVMEDFTKWGYRKCSDLNLNTQGEVINKFRILDNEISNIHNTLSAIEKANKFIGE